MTDDVVVTTPRLLVRRLVAADADALHAYRSDPDVARYQGWELPYPRARAETLIAEMETRSVFALGEWTQLAIATRAEPEALVGDVGVRMEADEPTAELGVTVAPAHQHRGYAGEALRALTEHLFHRLAVARVVAFTHRDNVAAQHALEAGGLRFVTSDGDEFVYYRRAQ